MKKGTYKTKKQNRSEVREPLGTYSASHNPIVINDSVIPDGYLSLERFGEIFHQNSTPTMKTYKVTISGLWFFTHQETMSLLTVSFLQK